jgi:hypothetical protein
MKCRHGNKVSLDSCPCCECPEVEEMRALLLRLEGDLNQMLGGAKMAPETFDYFYDFMDKINE